MSPKFTPGQYLLFPTNLNCSSEYCILKLLFCFPEEIYGTETKIITMDFTGGAEIYDGLPEKLAGLDIGILGK